MQARNMLAKGQDILANKTSAGGKIPVIYGTRRVGAQIIYMDVNANDSRDLYVVYALSVGECDEILGRTIELDGNPLTDSARFRDGGYIGSDKISSGSGH
jgi:NaMN:DMB phosphoribosyltransferase